MVIFGPGRRELRSTPLGRVGALFPPWVSGVLADTADAIPTALFPTESAAVSRAVPARREEFAAGRWCARRALAELGISAQALPVGSDRAPVWPAGIVGSITHCQGLVGAVVARTARLIALGFDAEPATPLGNDLPGLVCTASELDWVRRSPVSPAPADWPKVIFCAKEALHKCVAPLYHVMLDFRDVSLALEPSGIFSARIEPSASVAVDVGRVCGRFAMAGAFVFAAAFIEAA
jgi:4'-phosphopantetheinyl transferase EntD